MRIIRQYWIYLFFLAAVALYLFVNNRDAIRMKRGKETLSMKTFMASDGWGYDLYVNDSLYIHQAYIPAITGRKVFASEAQAGTIGALALSRLQTSRFPVITVSELDSCRISY